MWVMRAKQQSGCGRWTTELVQANVLAGAENTRQRDLPDVLGWKDFSDHPRATRDSLARRVAEDRVPGPAASFPLPKPGKGELRRMAYLHPLDELQMRLLVDNLLTTAPHHFQRHSFGARLSVAPPGWVIEPSKQAWERLRWEASRLIASGRYATMIKCDIRSCYPSITADVVEQALLDQGFDSRDITSLVHLLRELPLVGAPKGLPIGPEASAVIADLVLDAVDQAFAESEFAHLRYSDDSFIFVPNGASPDAAHETYRQALGAIGLQPNSEKRSEHPVEDGSAWEVVQDPTVSTLLRGGFRYCDVGTLVSTLDAEIEAEQPNWNAVSFCLGSLRYRRSPLALPRIYEHSEISLNIPRQVGSYLYELFRDVDQDWLISQATADHGDAGLATQLHMCRVASRVKLGEVNGQRLEEIATASPVREAQRSPVRAFAAHAWAYSKGYRPRRAEEIALHLGHYDTRRALINAIASTGQSSRRIRSFRKKMWSADPDLKPVLEGLR